MALVPGTRDNETVKWPDAAPIQTAVSLQLPIHLPLHAGFTEDLPNQQRGRWDHPATPTRRPFPPSHWRPPVRDVSLPATPDHAELGPTCQWDPARGGTHSARPGRAADPPGSRRAIVAAWPSFLPSSRRGRGRGPRRRAAPGLAASGRRRVRSNRAVPTVPDGLAPGRRRPPPRCRTGAAALCTEGRSRREGRDTPGQRLPARPYVRGTGL